ncbi:MAG TPA: hypothetical protein VES42_19155 [Pilimelia sp.]|nr:hypothetical protein [Pilimelia sp.]
MRAPEGYPEADAAPHRIGRQRDGHAARTGPLHAPTTPVPTPPPAPRRRRWWLAVVVLLSVLTGAGIAVLAQRDDPATRSTGAPPDPAPVATGPGVAASPTPSGFAGLGPNPSPVPSATPRGSATPTPGLRPFPAPRRTLPGATIHYRGNETFAQALARSDRAYGPLRMVRVFHPGLPPAWRGSPSDVADRTVVVSFKAPPAQIAAGRHDARLAKWFAGMPRNSDIYWTYFHEPEDDVESGKYTTAQFRAAWRRLAGLADRAGNPRLRATLVLMCWTLDPGSRRSFTDYYPGSDVIDVLGWDCYNDGAKVNQYWAPERVFRRMISKSRALGKPWGVAETGSLLVAGDSGARRAAWIRAAATYLNGQKPLWVAYYDYRISKGDYRLTDAPSQQAWQAFCAAAA